MLLGKELTQGVSIRLTGTTAADAASFQAALADSVLLPTLVSRYRSPQVPQEWYSQHISPLEMRFAIRRLEDDTLVGLCGLGSVQWQARHASLLLAFCQRECWMDGTAGEVLAVLERYAFMEANLNRLAVYVPDFNALLADALQGAGWQAEGRLRQAVYRDNALGDMLIFGRLQREWSAGTN